MNETEYGSAKIIKSFHRKRLHLFSRSECLDKLISSNFQDFFAKTFEINLLKQNFNNCCISNFCDVSGKSLL